MTFTCKLCLRAYAISIILAISLTAGCGNSTRIVGTWQRITGDVCGNLYPEQLSFLDDGTYIGGVLIWNGGKYNFVDDKRIKLETSTGPGLYEIRISKKELTFITDWGCRLRYAKKN